MGKRKASSRTEDPLIVKELQLSYAELLWMIQQMNDAPPEISRKIASFFIVKPVVPSEVKVTHASSTSGQHPLSAALDEDISTWWISGGGRMPRGRGREYLEFQLSSRGVRRLTKFSIQIPPLPMGPLSVRRLQLERQQEQGTDRWSPCSPIWTIENRTGWQNYTLNPSLDIQNIRVVCLSNQMALMLRDADFDDGDDADNNPLACVGYYCVKFE